MSHSGQAGEGGVWKLLIISETVCLQSYAVSKVARGFSRLKMHLLHFSLLFHCMQKECRIADKPNAIRVCMWQ